MEETSPTFQSARTQGESSYACFFSITNDKNEIVCLLGTHVDDLLWAADEESQKIIDAVLAELDIREV